MLVIASRCAPVLCGTYFVLIVESVELPHFDAKFRKFSLASAQVAHLLLESLL